MVIDSISEKLSGETKPCIAAKDTAGDAAKAGAHGEGQQLEVARIDADRLGGNFILAYRLPGAANARILQTQVDDDDQDGERDQQKVILLRSTQE
jgi:hypothetical protein